MIVLKPKEREIARLLLQGCENADIAKRLGMKLRTLKGHFTRMFTKCAISEGGIRRVKLAVKLFKDASWNDTDPAYLAGESARSSASSPPA